MTSFTYQSFLDNNPQTDADADSTLYVGPSVTLVGLPAAQDRSDWCTVDEPTGNSPAQLTPDNPLHEKSRQGVGYLLLYAEDSTLLVKLAVVIYAHSGTTQAAVEQAMLTLTRVHRAREYHDTNGTLKITARGFNKGYTIGPPRVHYVAVPQADEGAGGRLNDSVTLYHATGLATGEVASAYIMYTEDGFGQSISDVASEVELLSHTPEQLSADDAERALVWLKVPLGTSPADVLSLTTTTVERGTHFHVWGDISFAINLLSEAREEAVITSFRKTLTARGIGYFDASEQAYLNSYAYYMRLDVTYGTVVTESLDEGTFAFTRSSALMSAFRLPEQGQFYFELDTPASGNQYLSVGFVESEDQLGYYVTSRDDYGQAYYDHNPSFNVIYDTDTLRVLVDFDALTVRFMMGDNDVGAEVGAITRLLKGYKYHLAVGNRGDGPSSAGTVRLRFTEDDFIYSKPEGYQAIGSLMTHASSAAFLNS